MIEIQEKDIRKVSAFRGERVPFLFFCRRRIYRMTVKEFFRQTPRAAAAFSGGTMTKLVLVVWFYLRYYSSK